VTHRTLSRCGRSAPPRKNYENGPYGRPHSGLYLMKQTLKNTSVRVFRWPVGLKPYTGYDHWAVGLACMTNSRLVELPSVRPTTPVRWWGAIRVWGTYPNNERHWRSTNGVPPTPKHLMLCSCKQNTQQQGLYTGNHWFQLLTAPSLFNLLRMIRFAYLRYN
jgi:hypothetical protein